MTNTKQKLVDYREGSFVDFEGKDKYEKSKTLAEKAALYNKVIAD